MKYEACPPIDPALLAYLNRLFPERCAEAGQTLEHIWAQSGARTVVRHLNVEMERQQKGSTNVSSKT